MDKLLVIFKIIISQKSYCGIRVIDIFFICSSMPGCDSAEFTGCQGHCIITGPSKVHLKKYNEETEQLLLLSIEEI